ncbi:MAG: ATP-binding protein [Wolinella sp.]
MKHLFEFIKTDDISKSVIFPHLKCNEVEAMMLRHMVLELLKGNDELVVIDMLNVLFENEEEEFGQLRFLKNIKNLLELGWVIQNSFLHIKLSEVVILELLNSSISLSSTFLKLLEDGEIEMDLPELVAYDDHLEYLKDQFLRIDILRKINLLKQSHTQDSPSLGRTKYKLKLLEERIKERVKLTDKEAGLEGFFKEHGLNEKERTIFIALLKEEYAGSDEVLRDMNSLIDLVSDDEYERIKNRALLDDKSPLVDSEIVDYDEILTPFGGISRTFFIPEETLQKITHPQKKKKRQKIKLETLIKEQDIFEFIEPKTSLDDVILHPNTREVMDNLLQQVDSRVIGLLKEWGIKDKRRGIDAKIIFYGAPGTGKTMSALSLAKSLKRHILSFDCSKILSMYVGESEKNVRKIFDTYKELAQKSKDEPILLLDEADQFLSTRTSVSAGGAEKMHNQMQNIFLEQIEKFEGILIATTNLLESLDSAFSRRFNYKIEFKKPDFSQRILLWQKMLPKNAKFEDGFDTERLAKYALTGGQISLIVKNTAYKVATREQPIFWISDFEDEIKKELSGNFDGEKSMGFSV